MDFAVVCGAGTDEITGRVPGGELFKKRLDRGGMSQPLDVATIAAQQVQQRNTMRQVKLLNRREQAAGAGIQLQSTGSQRWGDAVS